MPLSNFRSVFASILALSFTCGFASGAGAQEEDYTVTLGKSEFGKRCAVCHGVEGAGDGPVAELLQQPPANLREISKRNNGKFPILDVYQAIDGRRGLRAHGTQEMPLWGDYYNRDAGERLRVPHDVNYEEIVHGRILALVYYIQSLQVE
jgi:mono/diheme cytochrome c family protein